MSKRSLVTIVGFICVAAAVIINFPLTPAKAQMDHGNHSQMGRVAMQNHTTEAPSSLEMVHSGQLPILSMSIEKALNAVEQGDKKTALTELNKAKKMLAGIDLAIGKLVRPRFANDRCPIMGSTINPDKVSKDLIRDYKGQKVAFCCQGCPAQWDKLSDSQKAAKLAKAQPAAQKVWTCSMHPQINLPKPGSCPICKMSLIPLSTGQNHAGHKN